MNTGEKAGFLLVLTAIGAVSFAVFGAIYQARIGKPVAIQPLTQTQTAAVPAEVMRRGAAGALRVAMQNLTEGHRSEATHALDAGLRVMEVGAEAYGGAWHEAAKLVQRAKRALANGRLTAAGEALRAAREKMDEVEVAGSAPLSLKPGREYVGATLLNAAGVRIGELTAVGAEGGHGEAVLGGARDLYGFWDLGGEPVRVPPERLVYGPAQWPHSTMVLAPTLARDPAAVRAALQPR